MFTSTHFATTLFLAAVAIIALEDHGFAEHPAPLQITTFEVDVTPPIGTPLCDALVAPASKIVDRLSARGMVILTNEKPIVLCAVDWVGIGNGGHDAWREALAKAANTTADRVSVHCLHQHDTPGCDFDADEILQRYQLGGKMFDVKFAREAIGKTADALAKSLDQPRSVTHLGLGMADVEKVASNRRILGDDGKVKIVRYSKSSDPAAIAAPEGVIDSKLRSVSFWDDDKIVAVMTFYATHPQSYYGQGGISADFVGLARNSRVKDSGGVQHLHFNGAGGNVAAGKYNDGSPEVRPVLAKRLASGMKMALENTRKLPILDSDIRWSYEPVTLPTRDFLVQDALEKRIADSQLPIGRRCQSARELAFLNRMESGKKININCLQLGPAWILFMPGELFVEYQLAAQAMRPDAFVATVAYGDYGPSYIGTKISYSQGGYETGRASRTAPSVEELLIKTIQKLLKINK